MIKYITLSAFIFVGIVFTLSTNTLMRRSELFLKDSVDFISDKNILYLKISKDGTMTHNFETEILNKIKAIEEPSEVKLPRRGIYKFTISNINGEKIIKGVPI